MANADEVFGIINHDARKTDYLYRVSLKCVIKNPKGKVLVVKEAGRNWWDLPGGGMDHGESIKSAIAREMREEVTMQGEFTYRILAVEEPALLNPHSFWQIRLIFAVEPEVIEFVAGDDGDEVAFMEPGLFKDSTANAEQRIYEYAGKFDY